MSEGSSLARDGSKGSLWGESRVRLHQALATQSELFADLYRRAVDALSEAPLSHGALVVAAHCIRDLVNGLPDVLDGVGEVPPHVALSEPAKDLAAAWEAHPTSLGPVHNSVMRDDRDSDEIALMAVPTELVEAARLVAVASLTATDNSRRRRSALVLGRAELRVDPSVRVFQQSVSVLEQVRHPQRGREIDVDKVRTDVLQALPVIEAALEARLGSFFETVEDLMDVLNSANDRSGT